MSFIEDHLSTKTVLPDRDDQVLVWVCRHSIRHKIDEDLDGSLSANEMENANVLFAVVHAKLLIRGFGTVFSRTILWMTSYGLKIRLETGSDEIENDCLSQTELKKLKIYFQVKRQQHGSHELVASWSIVISVTEKRDGCFYFIFLVSEIYRKMTFQFHNFQLNI